MADSTDNLVFGIHAVSRLLSLRPQRLQEILMVEHRNDAAMRLIIDTATRHGVALRRLSAKALDRLAAGGRHQGVIAQITPAPLLDEGGLEDLLDDSNDPLLLVLDGVQDPHNLGACLRTAEAAGAAAVIIPRDRAVGMTPTVRKVAAGSADFIPLARITNLARVLRRLTERGIWCFGADASADTDLYSLDLTGPSCLVLGSEGSGLRRLTRERCDQLYSLPMHGGTESLNVSVATGISLYEACRQRRAGTTPSL